MRVVHLNTYENFGGAAIAGNRLVKALNEKYHDISEMLNASDTKNIQSLASFYTKVNFALDVFKFSLKAADPSYKFRFSLAEFGSSVYKNKKILEADIIHIHWVNQGFLSLSALDKLISLNKPIVWTLHDMWPFTGGCHYSETCSNYRAQCGNCFYLKNPDSKDISHDIWRNKSHIFNKNTRVTFSACSNWLKEVAQSSAMTKNIPVVTIPNPIDTEVFSPQEKAEIRKRFGIDVNKKIILFGASNINEERKGLKYLIASLNLLIKEYTENDIEVVIFGKSKGFDESLIPLKVYNMGSVNTELELSVIYNLADVFVLPSLEDNLPNMVMEALSCGIPSVTFNTGGLPDLIEHQYNGYLAEYKSSEDLKNGILWALENRKALSDNARKKVLSNFSNHIVAAQYFNLYTSLLNE